MDNPIIVNGISKTLTLQSFGVSIQFSQGLKSQSKTLPFQQILTAVVVKPGLTAGYIYFQLNGVENRPVKNTNDAIKNENAVAFWGNDNYQKALQVKQAVEQWQANASMATMQPTIQNVQAPSGADELLKYKQLLDAGAITQEEFDEKKKQLLQQPNQASQQTQPVQQAQPVYQSNTVPPTPTKKKHGCLIGFIVIFLVLAFIVGISVSTTNSGNGSTTSGNDSSAVSMSPEELKAQADAFDEEIWAQIVEIIKAHNNMMQYLVAYSEGTATALDVYDYCDDVYTQLSKFKAPSGTNDNERQYATNTNTYAIYVQTEAEAIREYVNNPTTENLATVEDNINLVNEGTSSIASTRGTFLGASGFTDEEIQEKASKLEEELQ